ncbi:MAG: hypothetical protein LBO04_03110 [Spirochaetaceae bacterium]|jgi:transposase-like protein|nr:hypothetical protein [Spirochaetaceae bacterium]
MAPAEKREKPVSLIAADLGINENMPRRWIQQARDSGGTGLPPLSGHGRLRDEELSRLRKEVKAPREAAGSRCRTGAPLGQGNIERSQPSVHGRASS